MANAYFDSSQYLIDELNRRSQVEGDGGKNFLTNLMKGGLSVNEDGDVQRDNFAYYLQPFTNNKDTDSIAKQKQAIQNAKAIEKTLSTYNVNPNQLVKSGVLNPGDEITKDNVGSFIADYRIKKSNEITPQGEVDNALKKSVVAADSAARLAELAKQTQILENSANASNNNLEIARIDKDFNREELQANTNLQLQLGLMNADTASERLAYDKETRRLDRRDMAIAQLMQGAGNIASLFAYV